MCIYEPSFCLKCKVHTFLHLVLQKEKLASYYPKMLIKCKITGSDLLFFWNIEHVHTGAHPLKDQETAL